MEVSGRNGSADQIAHHSVIDLSAIAIEPSPLTRRTVPDTSLLTTIAAMVVSLEVELIRSIARLRYEGVSWTEIGQAIGLSTRSARRKYGTYLWDPRTDSVSGLPEPTNPEG